jgi:Na+-transporting NADH:ubiquinone oxidoreductase subunit NqrE
MFVQLSFLARAFSINNNNNIYLLQMGCHPVAVIKCFESLSIAIGMKNAVHMRHTVASSVNHLTVWYLSTSHDGMILKKKVRNLRWVL